MSFAIRYIVALWAFWLLDGAGAMQVTWLTGVFFSGMLLPLNVFPRRPRRPRPPPAVVRAAPGARRRAAGARPTCGATFAFQAGWAVVLLAVGRLIQSAATRKVVVQGG